MNTCTQRPSVGAQNATQTRTVLVANVSSQRTRRRRRVGCDNDGVASSVRGIRIPKATIKEEGIKDANNINNEKSFWIETSSKECVLAAVECGCASAFIVRDDAMLEQFRKFTPLETRFLQRDGPVLREKEKKREGDQKEEEGV